MRIFMISPLDARYVRRPGMSRTAVAGS